MAVSRIALEWWAAYQEQLQLSFEEYIKTSLTTEACSFSSSSEPTDPLESQGICAIIGITGSHS
ncbi:hypothetical protein JZU71_00135, partial [bacterium]|nr:hypothetical protein [bacterium]